MSLGGRKAARVTLATRLGTLRAAMAAWYERRFKVSLSPNQHVVPLNGARTGLAAIPMLVTNPGDVVLVPDPGYPLYAAAAQFAGATAAPIPLRSDGGFLPDLAAIPAAATDRARLLYLNYPNSPTGAIAPASFYHEVVALARRHNLVVCQDMSFAGVSYEGYRPLSFLEIPGALDVGVEVHSLSIAFNMPGYGIGVLLGNRQLVEAMGRVQAVLGAPLPEPIQHAARAAVDATPPDWFQRRDVIYRDRRDLVVRTLAQVGLVTELPKATPCVWAALPAGQAAEEYAAGLLKDCGVWVLPGTRFGRQGEGYVRISLTVPDDRLHAAMRRVASRPASSPPGPPG
jgi:LL-diaminopimelate aminotransferase